MRDAAPDPDTTPVECEAGTTVCDDAMGRYVECGADGVSTRVIDCPLGCAQDAENCLDVAPSNGLAGYLDRARDDEAVVSVTFSGASTMNTDSGEVTNAGAAITVPSVTANGIRVFMFKDVQVPGTLKVTGTLPVAFVADGNVIVTGLVDVSADATASGPGAVSSTDCVGADSIGVNDIGGGGGAGHLQAGGDAGSSYGDPTVVAKGGATASEPDLDPLVGGCRGGTARRIVFPEPPPNGGGGGGALQIVSRRSVALTGGGTIDASGGSGRGSLGGAGGGSGGSVLIEAPAITIDGPAVVISTKGAGGGSGQGNQSPGTDGGTDAAPAAGGAASGYATGGAGGTETAAPGNGGNGNSTHTGGAGGGGSVGEARFNTRSAAVSPSGGAAIRSRYSVGTIGSRQMQL